MFLLYCKYIGEKWKEVWWIKYKERATVQFKFKGLNSAMTVINTLYWLFLFCWHLLFTDTSSEYYIAFVLLTPKKCFCADTPRNHNCVNRTSGAKAYQKRCAFKINPMKRREIYLRESRSVIHSFDELSFESRSKIHIKQLITTTTKTATTMVTMVE